MFDCLDIYQHLIFISKNLVAKLYLQIFWCPWNLLSWQYHRFFASLSNNNLQSDFFHYCFISTRSGFLYSSLGVGRLSSTIGGRSSATGVVTCDPETSLESSSVMSPLDDTSARKSITFIDIVFIHLVCELPQQFVHGQWAVLIIRVKNQNRCPRIMVMSQ